VRRAPDATYAASDPVPGSGTVSDEDDKNRKDNTMGKFATRTAMKLGAVAAASALLLTACSGQSPTTQQSASSDDIESAMSTPTTVTIWTWNDLTPEVALFEKKYPDITVDLVKVTSGNDFYTKLRSAIKAGKGAPDIAQVEYHHLPSFILGQDVADISPYLDADTEGKFEDFAWSQVATDNGVFGVPQDTGPLGLLYRNDIFTDAGIDTAPATWDDFAEDAKAIHAADDGQYIANISPSNASATLGLFWQAGARPFSYDGKETVSVDLTSPEMQQVAEYWQKLIDADLVSTDPDFTDTWYQGLANGKYASWVAAAWGPLYLQGTAADTAGDWSAATLPQWKVGENVSANVGGSALSVLSSSENPIPAAKFAEFINSDPESTLQMAKDLSLFSAASATLASPEFTDSKLDFFGGQQVNKLYAEISPTVSTGFQWLPFMDPVFESYNDTFGKALTDGTSLTDGLQAWQDQVVSYAESQGFTVK
jgi:multiple sugar transport system substrate-binding protein